MKQTRESLNLRVPSSLKREIQEYADRVGISLNAAACILLTKAVDRRDRVAE